MTVAREPAAARRATACITTRIGPPTRFGTSVARAAKGASPLNWRLRKRIQR